VAIGAIRLFLIVLWNAVLGFGAAVAADFHPDSVLVVVPGDGRQQQPVPVVERGTTAYVPLGALARALGVPFAWDPFAYRGWIATDSVRTTFTLDSPVLTHGGDLIQLTAPLGYGERGLLIPVDYLQMLTERWHGVRAVGWRPQRSIFYWGADAAAVKQLRLSEIGHHTELRLMAPRAPKSDIFWSPAAGLDVVITGLAPHPESLDIGPPRGVFAIREVRGWPGGGRILVDVGAQALGADVGYDAGDHVWELTGTTSRDEVDKGGFRPLQPADRPEAGSLQGPILVTCFVDPAIDPAEGVTALSDLADRIVRTLSDTLMVPAEFMPSVSPLDDVARANAAHARCLIGLRLDRYGTGVGALQIWAAAPRLRWEPLERANATTRRPMLWSEAPAISRAESQRIASSLASHIETLIGSGKVDVGSRPSRWLEGTTMPALLIYPAQLNDPISLERLMNFGQRAGLARAISFAIAEALTAGSYIEATQ
jgi:hypothetical protein